MSMTENVTTTDSLEMSDEDFLNSPPPSEEPEQELDPNPQQEEAEVRARVCRGDDACRDTEAEPADLRAGESGSMGIRRDTHALGKVAHMLRAGGGVRARPQRHAAAHI